jgi:hypothetical protein
MVLEAVVLAGPDVIPPVGSGGRHDLMVLRVSELLRSTLGGQAGSIVTYHVLMRVRFDLSAPFRLLGLGVDPLHLDLSGPFRLLGLGVDPLHLDLSGPFGLLGLGVDPLHPVGLFDAHCPVLSFLRYC